MTTTSQATGMKQAALALAGRGWAVFPLTPRSKRPLPGSRGLLEATTDPVVIERMWRDHLFANVGINCGMSGLYVIDVDMNPWKNKQGGATWAALVGEHGHVDTYAARTWSGGLHFDYRMPEGMTLTNTTGEESAIARGLGLDVDTRGAGGYVVAPPSFVREVVGAQMHDGTYALEKDLDVAPLPLWVPGMVAQIERERPTVAGPVAAEEMVMERLQALSSQLAAAPDGQGNDTASRVAYMAGQYVGAGQVDYDTAVEILLQAISGWDYRSDGDYRSMTTTILRQVMAGQSNPRAWERPVALGRPPVAQEPTRASSAAPAGAGGSAGGLLPDPFGVPKEDIDPVEEADRAISMWGTDNGQGVYLRDKVGRMLYAVGVGWMVWDGCRWKRVAPEVIQNKVSRFYRRQFEKMLAQYMATMDEKYQVLAKAFKGFMSSARLGSILNHLKVTDGVLVDVADLDTHKDLLNTPAGILDLRTGLATPHDPKMLFTKITRGSYRPGFTHTDWEIALTALPPEGSDYLQIRLGQAITGHIPESDDALFLMGTGSNGKSSYTSDGVFPAIGDYAALAQPTLITKATEGSGPTPERFGLMGCRFVLIEELPEGRSLSIAEIKRIVGTSVITARDLHEKQVTFPANHTLAVTTNFPPAVAEVDEGSWRRLCRIDFPFSFKTDPEGPMDRAGDPGLKARLRQGADGQHDAIVTWLVKGAMRYYADPILIMKDRRPESVATSTLAWRKQADRILAFVEERLDFPGPDDEVCNVTRKDLFSDFLVFLEQQGHAKWSQETFLSRFRTHEQIRNRQVTEGQVRRHSTISRPPLPPNVTFSSAQPPLANMERVFRGVVFRPLD